MNTEQVRDRLAAVLDHMGFDGYLFDRSPTSVTFADVGLSSNDVSELVVECEIEFDVTLPGFDCSSSRLVDTLVEAVVASFGGSK